MYDYKTELNRVAETQYMIRPVLVNALKKQELTSEYVRKTGCANYFEFWEQGLADRFFDMGNMIRLGTAIEGCLKAYYMDRKRFTNLSQLRSDPSYRQNIFQQVQAWQPNGVITLFEREFRMDLRNNKSLALIQEAMMHRHLYAHNSGLLDEDYIDRIMSISGQDLRIVPEIAKTYPQDDTYWFEPLQRIGSFIEGAKKFFSEL